MIFANINDKTTSFICQNKYLAKAFKWLKDTDLESIKPGKYDISDGIFVKIQEYNTKDESKGRFENHEAHLDFHYLISGEEMTRVTRPHGLVETDNSLGTPDDVAHYKRFDGSATQMALHSGDYIILFPEDAHEACLDLDKHAVPCKKAVIKVPVSLLN